MEESDEAQFAAAVRRAVLDMIGMEREFQVNERHYDWLHDVKQHTPASLAAAAAYFMLPDDLPAVIYEEVFGASGLDPSHDKRDTMTELQRYRAAAALQVAAIERLYIKKNWEV